MLRNDDESQSRYQRGRVSRGYSQLLVRVMVQVSWACNVHVYTSVNI